MSGRPRKQAKTGKGSEIKLGDVCKFDAQKQITAAASSSTTRSSIKGVGFISNVGHLSNGTDCVRVCDFVRKSNAFPPYHRRIRRSIQGNLCNYSYSYCSQIPVRNSLCMNSDQSESSRVNHVRTSLSGFQKNRNAIDTEGQNLSNEFAKITTLPKVSCIDIPTAINGIQFPARTSEINKSLRQIQLDLVHRADHISSLTRYKESLKMEGIV